MKHIHGISIRLTSPNGTLISESPPTKRTEHSLLRFNGQVGSRNVCLKPGQAFKVEITIHKNFKIYKATGIKVRKAHDADRCICVPRYTYIDV